MYPYCKNIQYCNIEVYERTDDYKQRRMQKFVKRGEKIFFYKFHGTIVVKIVFWRSIFSELC